MAATPDRSPLTHAEPTFDDVDKLTNSRNLIFHFEPPPFDRVERSVYFQTIRGCYIFVLNGDYT